MHILSIRRSKNTATNKTDYWYQIRLAGIQNDLPAQAPLKTGWLKAETVTLYKYNDWLTATGEIEGRLHYTGYPAQSPLVATLIDAETLKPVYLPDYEHEKRFTYKIRFSLRVLPGRYYLLFIPQHLLEQPAATTYLKQLMQTTDGTYVPLVVQPAGVTTGGEFWPDFSLEKYLNKK
jgi:hypothetical protein